MGSFIGCLVLIFGIILFSRKSSDYHFIEKDLKKSKSEILGKEGEIEVSQVLNTLPNDKYVIINDLIYLYNNSTRQIDHVVVSNYGIFIIETKNYSGKIYGSDKYNTWIQYLGKKKYKMLNPILQNYGHMKALEDKIPEYKHYFIPIVCFTNKSILAVKTKNIVINLNKLTEIILSYKTEVLIPDIFEVAQNLKNLSLQGMDGISQDHLDNIKKYKKR